MSYWTDSPLQHSDLDLCWETEECIPSETKDHHPDANPEALCLTSMWCCRGNVKTALQHPGRITSIQGLGHWTVFDYFSDLSHSDGQVTRLCFHYRKRVTEIEKVLKEFFLLPDYPQSRLAALHLHCIQEAGSPFNPTGCQNCPFLLGMLIQILSSPKKHSKALIENGNLYLC